MKKYWNKLVFVTLSLLAVGAVSCDDDEVADEFSARYVYLMPEHLGMLTKNVTLTHTGDGISGPETQTTFTICLNRPVEQDVTIGLETALNEVLPEDKVTLSSPSVTIPAGKTVSEPVTVSVSDWSFAVENKLKTEYKVTVKVASAGAGVKIGQQKEVYLDITKNAFLNLASASSATVKGKQIADRKAWVITLQDGCEGPASNLVDGSTGSDVARNGVFWVQIDLGAKTNISALYTRHWGAAYAPRMIEVYTSDDGDNWMSQGQIARSGNQQYTNLISPVEARYIKYDIVTNASSGRTDITEFYVYAME